MLFLFISENVARGKTCSQHPDTGNQWPASNAVDGSKTACKYDSYLAISGNAYYPWWQVDLGALYDISNITVYGRPNVTHAGKYFHTILFQFLSLTYDLYYFFLFN